MRGLNLHRLVRPAVTAVNPDHPVVVLRSAGQAIDADYVQHPLYFPAVLVMAQPQPVSDSELQFLVQERENSVWHDFYLDGDWSALLRDTEKGGDLVYWDGAEWLVKQVLERWNPTAGWTKLRCTRQRSVLPPTVGDSSPPAQNAQENSNGDDFSGI